MREVLIPKGAAIILDTLRDNGFEAYVVGGCVRDSLLGRVPKDWDICTSAMPNDVERCFSGRKIVETGVQHGTVTVFVDGVGFEVTTFRTDGKYSDNRRPDSVEFVNDIELDLSRRDFTMNAMAYNDEVGLVDPFGGMESIQNKVIACVGNPDDRFSEDALRIMRTLRFASTYEFSISPNTAMSIHRNAELLNNIAAERINLELCKLLKGNGVLCVLQTYSDVISVIVPELAQCVGFNQNNRFHQYDVYEHIAHAVSHYKGDDDVVNVALMLHDVGKPLCYSEDERGGHFYNHASTSGAITEKVVSRLRFDSQSKHDIVELVFNHAATIEPNARTVKKWLNKLGEKQFFRLMDLRLADIQAHAEGTQSSRLERRDKAVELARKILASNQCFTIKDLAINGKDVMQTGIQEGPIVGAALNVALEGVINDRVQNEKQELLLYICKFICFVQEHMDVYPFTIESFCPFLRGGYCTYAHSDKCYSCEIPMEEWDK